MATDKPKYYTITHSAIPYICLPSSIPSSDLPTLAHKIPQLFSILASTTPPTSLIGPPVFRYVAIPVGMGRNQRVEMEVGVPVPENFTLPVPENFTLPAPNSSNDAATGAFKLKSLLAGTYLETIHVSPPSTLRDATRKYLQYAEKEGLEFDMERGDEGSLTDRDKGRDGKEDTELKDRWASRLE